MIILRTLGKQLGCSGHIIALIALITVPHCTGAYLHRLPMATTCATKMGWQNRFTIASLMATDLNNRLNWLQAHSALNYSDHALTGIIQELRAPWANKQFRFFQHQFIMAYEAYAIFNQMSNDLVVAWNNYLNHYSHALTSIETYRIKSSTINRLRKNCSCNALQAKQHHDEIVVYTFNLPLKAMKIIQSDQTEIAGTPASQEQALWYIPFCHKAARSGTRIFEAHINNRFYQWLLPSFNKSNLELQLIPGTQPDANPILRQVTECGTGFEHIELPIVNKFELVA